MKDLFVRTLREASPHCRWRLEPIYTIGAKTSGGAVLDTYTMPIGRPRRVWGVDEAGTQHTPASLVATALGIPIEGGMFTPLIGERLSFYRWQCDAIIAASEGRSDDPAFDPGFRSTILDSLGLREP